MAQLSLQRNTIKAVSEILKNYQSVLGFALVGSHATDNNTSFSDIDFVVIFATEDRQDLQDIFDKICEIFPTLSTLYQLFDQESLILFTNGVRLDISFLKPSKFSDWILKDVKILHDPQGIISARKEQTIAYSEPAPKPKWNEEEGSYIDWFFWMFRQAYCYAYQSKMSKEKSFEKLDSAISTVSSIRTKLLETLFYVRGRKDYLSNLSSELDSQFKQTLSIRNADDVLYVTREMVKIYTEIIKMYCDKDNLDFPSEKIQTLLTLFDEFDQSPGIDQIAQ